MRTIFAILLSAAALLAADPPRRAPGFAITDRQMKVHDLYDYRGKPVILEFMQTACPHCAAFSEVLNKVQAKFGDKISILVVANPPDNFNTVGQYIAAHKITYPVLFDMGQVAYSYVLKPSFDLPQIYLIDAKGMIVSSYGYSPLTQSISKATVWRPRWRSCWRRLPLQPRLQLRPRPRRRSSSQHHALIAFAACDVFAVEKFQQWDRVLARDPGPFFEGWHGEPLALACGQQFAQCGDGGLVKHQVVADFHKAFLAQKNL